MRKLFLFTILVFISLFFFCPEAYAEDTSPIKINELYPDPTDESNEFIEINIGILSEVEFLDKFEIRNHKAKTLPKSSVISQSNDLNLLTIYTGRTYLRNSGGAVQIIEKESGEIIDTICYGKLEADELVDLDCKTVLSNSPPKGYSVQYIEELNQFLELEPTPEKPNEAPLIRGDQGGFNYEGIIINEVLPNPEGTDSGNEWLELYNSGDESRNLNGLEIQRVTDTKIYSHKIEEDLELKPDEYLVIHPSFTLTNENCTLQLVDTLGNAIDTFTYNSKIGDDESIVKNKQKNLITLSPTPGKKNVYTPRLEDIDTDFSDIQIIEILPNPAGKDIKGENEWIKVKNTSTKNINLKGLNLIQTTKREYDFVIEKDLILKSGKTLKLHPDFSINNTAARIEIQNGIGEKFDHVTYDGKIKDDQVLTRGNGNIMEIPEEKKEEVKGAEAPPKLTIQKAKELPKESQATITGVVNVEKDILDEGDFYIQDDSGGIKVDTKDNSQTFQAGEVVEITGEVDTYHGEPRIKPEAEILKTGQTQKLAPVQMKTGEANDDLLGMLVTVTGTVTETSGDTFYVDDGSGEIKIYIKDSTGIERPPCRKGYYARITGILSVWDKTKDGKPNYRLLPRYQEDVFISKTLANTGQNVIFPTIFGLLLLLLLPAFIAGPRNHRYNVKAVI